MKLKEIIKGLTNFKVFFSLLGGVAISSGFPLLGNIIWLFVDGLWYNYYKTLNDKVSQTMFAAWGIIAAWGVIYWGIIV